MKRALLLIALLLATAVHSPWAAEAGSDDAIEQPAQPWDGWHRDWDEAVQEAQSNDLPVLAVFTGSPWSQPSKALEKDVLHGEVFPQWYPQRVVLFAAFVPEKKEQTEAYETMDKLRSGLGLSRDVPAWAFCTPDGKAFARGTGYKGEPKDKRLWFIRANQALSPYKKKQPPPVPEPEQPVNGGGEEPQPRPLPDAPAPPESSPGPS